MVCFKVTVMELVVFTDHLSSLSLILLTNNLSPNEELFKLICVTVDLFHHITNPD